MTYIHTYIHAYIHTYIHAYKWHTYIHTHTPIHAYIHAKAAAPAGTSVEPVHSRMHTYVHIHVHEFEPICMQNTYMKVTPPQSCSRGTPREFTCMHGCKSIISCMYHVSWSIYIYIYIYIYTYDIAVVFMYVRKTSSGKQCHTEHAWEGYIYISQST